MAKIKFLIIVGLWSGLSSAVHSQTSRPKEHGGRGELASPRGTPRTSLVQARSLRSQVHLSAMVLPGITEAAEQENWEASRTGFELTDGRHDKYIL